MTAVQTKISILYPVIGAKQVSLWIAHDQGLFAKQGLEVTMIESLLNRSLPGRDHISIVETTGGALGQMRALESGEIDATVLDPSLSAQLIAKGRNLLMDLSSIDMPSIQDGIMVESSYLRAYPDTVEKVVIGLAEGIVFSQSPRNKEIVVKTLMKWLNISDYRAAELAYQESLTRANHDLEAS